MSAVLNTNVASLWASKNLLGAQSKLAGSVERLSSGLRINRARDDAAGLGVANSLTAQINGANQGVRNLNDAISMVQTAEGAIAAASEMGQRILMLATQGANGTLGNDERAAIKTEMLQLLSSIDAISGRTTFSGNALLGVSTQTATTVDKYSMQISNEATDKVVLDSGAFYNVGYTVDQAFQMKDYTAGGVADGTYTVYSKTASGSDSSSLLDDTFTAGTLVKSTSGGSTTYTLNGVSVATTDADASGQLYELSNTTGTGQATSLYNAVSAINVTVSSTNTSANITTNFQNIQSLADSYVINLGTQRSLLGAYQNQMEYTLSNITELSSNLSSARSRVIDTDYASETASLTKGQILQQAATAMLAQANQMPNVILTLLK